MLRVKKNAL